MELPMTSAQVKAVTAPVLSSKEEEYSIPLCIDDLLVICREYNRLGYQMQQQIETILETGVAEAIDNGVLKNEALPHIHSFLLAIVSNPYFGDATSQAQDCIQLIEQYQSTLHSTLN
jgi:hypothetical protein